MQLQLHKINVLNVSSDLLRPAESSHVGSRQACIAYHAGRVNGTQVTHGDGVWTFLSTFKTCQRQEASLQHTLAKLTTVGMQSIEVRDESVAALQREDFTEYFVSREIKHGSHPGCEETARIVAR